MTDRLADKLGLRVGQMVRVEVLEGRQRTVDVPLTATVREMMGLNAYMERRAEPATARRRPVHPVCAGHRARPRA